MIATFINISSTKFSLNGLSYNKSFIALKIGGDYVRVVSVYDTRLELLAITRFDSVKVDGVIHTNISNLINSLTDVLFSKTESGGSAVPGGAFSGVFDVSEGKDVFYNDYITGAVVNLSLGATKTLGSAATVRIKGSLTGSIPNDWTLSGTSISSSSDVKNEITVMYVSDTDIRAINRVIGVAVIEDTEAPSVPQNLALVSKTDNSITFGWDASTGTPDGYLIYNNGVFVKEVGTLTGQVTGLTAETPYSLTVSAIDAAGNESAQSAVLPITTNATAATGELITWEQFVGASSPVQGSLIHSTGGGAGYKIGAFSSKSMNGNGSVKYNTKVQTAENGTALGLTTGTINILSNDYAQMPIAVVTQIDGTYTNHTVIESDLQVFNDDTAVKGDIIELSLVGNTVSVKKNGTTIYTSGLSFTLPLTAIGLLKDEYPASEILNAEFTAPANLVTSPI